MAPRCCTASHTGIHSHVGCRDTRVGICTSLPGLQRSESLKTATCLLRSCWLSMMAPLTAGRPTTRTRLLHDHFWNERDMCMCCAEQNCGPHLGITDHSLIGHASERESTPTTLPWNCSSSLRSGLNRARGATWPVALIPSRRARARPRCTRRLLLIGGRLSVTEIVW